ncbi:hypothetical protein BsWGS_02524 [Bradybaena similaris]
MPYSSTHSLGTLSSFLFVPDGKGRWKNELSVEQRSFSVDYSRHYVEQIVREMSKKKSVSFPRPLDHDLRKQCSCSKLHGWMSKDQKLGSWLKQSMDNYPMEKKLSDTQAMTEKLRQIAHYKKKMAAVQKDESKKLLEYSKQCFESSLQEKDKAYLPRSGHEMVAMSVDQLSGEVISVQEEQQGQQISKEPENAGPREAERKLNHLKGQCKSQARICRHIRRMGEQYKVVCSAPPETCEEQWKLGRVAAGGGFLLVPVREPEEIHRDTVSEVEDQKPISEVPGQSEVQVTRHVSIATLPAHASTITLGTEVSEETNEESADYCWVDDATVSSISVDEAFTASEISEQRDRNDRPNVPTEPWDVGTELSFRSRKRHSSEKTFVTVDRSISRHGRETAAPSNVAKLKQQIEDLVLLEEDRESEYSIAAPETEPESEPEEEVEAKPPELICPSSAAKSHNSEIKMWLKKTPFMAASKVWPFLS